MLAKTPLESVQKRLRLLHPATSLDYASGLNKQILPDTHLNSLVEHWDSWHSLVMEMDAPELPR